MKNRMSLEEVINDMIRHIRERNFAFPARMQEWVDSLDQIKLRLDRVNESRNEAPKRHMQGRCECIETPTPNSEGYCRVCGGDLTGRVTTETIIHRS